MIGSRFGKYDRRRFRRKTCLLAAVWFVVAGSAPANIDPGITKPVDKNEKFDEKFEEKSKERFEKKPEKKRGDRKMRRQAPLDDQHRGQT